MASKIGIDILARDLASKIFKEVGDSAASLEQRLKGTSKNIDTVTNVGKNATDKTNKLGKGVNKLTENTSKLTQKTRAQSKANETISNITAAVNDSMIKQSKRLNVNEEFLGSLTKSQQDYNKKVQEIGPLFSKTWRKDQSGRIAKFARDHMEELGMSASTLGSSLDKMGYYLNEDNEITSIATGKALNQNAAMIKLKESTKRFRMELLSVMFFGMAIARIFASLTKGSLEASGAMGVWSTLTMLFGLPAAEDLTEELLKLLDIYDSLSPKTQKAISYGLYFGQALGTALMYVGMFGLGIEGLAKLFPGLGAVLKAGLFKGLIIGIKGAITTIVGLIGWILLIGVIIYGAILAWKENFWGFRNWLSFTWEGIKEMFSGIFDIIGGLFEALMALLSGDTDKMIEGLKRAWKGLGKFVEGFVVTLTGFVISLALAIIRPILGIFKVFSDLSAKLFDWLGIGKPEAWREVSAWLEGIMTKKFATGGIVTRPTTALIGEKGPEAVIPLGREMGMGGLTYSPTIYVSANVSNDIDIDRLANRLNERLFTQLREVNIR